MLESFFHALSQFAFDKAKDQVVSYIYLVSNNGITITNNYCCNRVVKPGVDVGFFLGGGAPLRDDITDWCVFN